MTKGILVKTVETTIPMLCQECNTVFKVGQVFTFDRDGRIQCSNCKAWTCLTSA